MAEDKKNHRNSLRQTRKSWTTLVEERPVSNRTWDAAKFRVRTGSESR